MGQSLHRRWGLILLRFLRTRIDDPSIKADAAWIAGRYVEGDRFVTQPTNCVRTKALVVSLAQPAALVCRRMEYRSVFSCGCRIENPTYGPRNTQKSGFHNALGKRSLASTLGARLLETQVPKRAAH